MAIHDVGLEKEALIKGRSPWAQAWHRLLKKKVGMAALAIIILFYFSGLFAPWVARQSYTTQNIMEAKQAPSLAHPFGTDRLGRDYYSRVIWGIRTTVIVTIASILTGSLLLGLFLGGISGYFGGKIDAAVMRVGEIFLAFPGLLLTILIAATVKPRVVEMVRDFEDFSGIKGIVSSGFVDYLVIFGALAAFSWVGMARLIRGQILYLKESQFVDAARAIGASPWRIIFRHLLPNAISPVIVSVSMGMGSIAGSEVVLSWLGIGVQPPNPSLGALIWENGNISVLRTDPHLLLFPVLAVAIIIFTWNLLGDALNDVLNPRTR